jgi:serine-type D-Ala-D-Ala carboxypeptidase/endopeptidase
LSRLQVWRTVRITPLNLYTPSETCMRLHSQPFALLFAPLFVLGLSSTAVRAELPSDAEARAILQKQIIDAKLARGAAAALVDAKGIRIVAAGESRDGVALKPDDLFEIGSVTKTFTGLLLATADEKGEAKLDDPVEKFLPDGMKLRDNKDVPIRLVDLATQRSGLPRLASNMQPADPKDPYSDYSERDLLDFVKLFKATRARDESYEYSNIGYGLLGYVLVRAAKADSFEALLTSRIFAPLGMTASTTDATKFTGRLVQPHDSAGRPTPAWRLPLAHAGAGAIRSTAGDMGRYAQAMAGLSTDSAISKAAALATTPRAEGAGRINPIGLAWMRVPFGERALANHDGATFGSSSSLFVDRNAKEAVFLVVNGSTRLFDIALHLLDKRHSIEPRVFPKTVVVAQDLLTRYPGTYKLNSRMDVTIRLRGDKLTAQATGQGEFEIFAESETRFFAKVAPINLTFGEFADGKATQFVFEQNGMKAVARRIAEAAATN